MKKVRFVDERVIRLFGNCIPVKGARRSTICDLQYQRAQLIPNDLYKILTEHAGKSVAGIKEHFNHECDALIDEYFTLLIRKNFAFWCDEPEFFTPLNLEWDSAAAFTNAIIDVDAGSAHDYTAIFTQLDSVGTQAVQIRSYGVLSVSEIERIVTASEATACRHLEFSMAYEPSFTDEWLTALCMEHHVITRLVFHSSPRFRALRLLPHPVIVTFSTGAMTPDSCGQVHPAFFSYTLQHFTEAQHFNTCLNRKISICPNGEIKNCPSMTTSFGNIATTTLRSLVGHSELVQIGSITKDQIAVCKDCEFRYVCTDCRAYRADPEDLYSKPARCSYDPYTATWGAGGE